MREPQARRWFKGRPNGMRALTVRIGNQYADWASVFVQHRWAANHGHAGRNSGSGQPYGVPTGTGARGAPKPWRSFPPLSASATIANKVNQRDMDVSEPSLERSAQSVSVKPRIPGHPGPAGRRRSNRRRRRYDRRLPRGKGGARRLSVRARRHRHVGPDANTLQKSGLQLGRGFHTGWAHRRAAVPRGRSQ